MDQFEAARLKSKQREERKARYMESVPEPVFNEIPVPLEATQIFKEKPKKHAVFTVNVSLPTGDFSFALTKTNVFSHISPSRLTASEIKRHMADGLKPLLGGLE